MRFEDWTGQRFGSLTALRYVAPRRWECRCDCGNAAVFMTSNLKRGHSTKCLECSRAARTVAPMIRLMERVIPEPNSGCWLFDGAWTERGYGLINVEGASTRTHRVVYEHFFGPVPDDLFVLHRCDTPPCCNPDHLFLGDHADNAEDAASKNRMAFGERQGMAKLSNSDVKQIRALLAAGITQREIGDQFGVDDVTISNINTGRNWAKVK